MPVCLKGVVFDRLGGEIGRHYFIEKYLGTIDNNILL